MSLHLDEVGVDDGPATRAWRDLDPAAVVHGDPAVARRGGFVRPVLPGLCTFGVTCRALLAACCGGDPTRLRPMAGRFGAPVLPGEELSVDVWRDRGRARFRTRTGAGTVAVDRGGATFD